SLTLPYLVLLRAGFCLPPVLPRARCALTAPFHPYPSTRARLSPRARSGRYVFCATVLQVTLTGRYPAHCPAEFGLSSPRLDGSRLRSGRAPRERKRNPHPSKPAACRERRLEPPSRTAAVRPAAKRLLYNADPALPAFPALRWFTHPSPARSGTAPASCTGCCAAY